MEVANKTPSLREVPPKDGLAGRGRGGLEFLSSPIKFLKGVGPERASALASELNIRTFGDLLNYFPFRYVDRTKIFKVNEINAGLPFVQLKGKISETAIAGEGEKKRLTAEFEDETGSVELVWFQGIKWISSKIKSGTEYVIFGKPDIFNNRFSIAHPEVEFASEENIKTAVRIQPVYGTGEKLKSKWLNSKGIWKLQRTLVQQIINNIPETLSEKILLEHKLISHEEAYRQIHLPENHSLLQKAEFRLKFEELFFLQLRLLQIKSLRKKNYSGFVFEKIGEHFNNFYNNHLPFQLTNAQKRVIKEIRSDMGSGKQMNRLLQGDVGSGKTIVALLSMLIAVDNDFQACLMAPTEILAQQHFGNITKLCLPPSPSCRGGDKPEIKKFIPSIALLTGSTKKVEREKIHEMLKSGELNILIGTHALLEEEVQFNNLGLAVIDEQHKFGVAQRALLWKKGKTPSPLGREGVGLPHVLVMTATPIPRTLAMTLYGDLDVSVIDELPPGRKPVTTAHRFYAQQEKVFDFIRSEIKKGRQAYIVYPIITESEALDYKDLEEGFALVKEKFPEPEYKVGMVHGRMKNELRDEQMKQFSEGKINILVATTVIEVGVDIPNACLMVIESAERFGLSQLHQLRGRVGRGADESYCILLTDYELTSDARTRMETMLRTSNGFEIAETDLRLRGPGDMAGTQQSGILDFRIADLMKDSQILHLARQTAEKILESDPLLSHPENAVLLTELNRLKKEKPYWGRIS